MSESYQTDCIVIGAGVVGLAIARSLAMRGQSTVLLESEGQVGTGISSRNSEVIHAGIYYRPGSLKAKLCVRGKLLLYEYCASHAIGHRQLGKLIVAVSEGELESLDLYRSRAEQNGVLDLRFLSGSSVSQLEPAVRCVGALFSPSTGIVDSHEFMLSLLSDFERAGGIPAFRSPVVSGHSAGAKIVVRVGGSEPTELTAPIVINSAGLNAQNVAASIEGRRPNTVPALHYAIGHYCAYSGRSPFQHLVYPVAPKGGLGVHVTLDMAGKVRFGPDVSWRDHCDYQFDDQRVATFYPAIRRYFPGLADGALRADYTGIRPKLGGPDAAEQDFLIQDASCHGMPGLIELFGIESPGLTASLAIAEHVVAICA